MVVIGEGVRSRRSKEKEVRGWRRLGERQMRKWTRGTVVGCWDRDKEEAREHARRKERWWILPSPGPPGGSETVEWRDWRMKEVR